MPDRARHADLLVATPISDFVRDALAGTAIDPESFWQGLSRIIADLTPRNRELLAERDRLQERIDAYNRDRPGSDAEDDERFLSDIGYLRPVPEDVRIATDGVDLEISTVAAPQLIVPLLNTRFALNAANARWGSLYDALYGTDAIPEEGPLARTEEYNSQRGAEVIRRGRELLDQVAPLTEGSHSTALGYVVSDGGLLAKLPGGRLSGLRDTACFAGYAGDAWNPASVLLIHHGLHLDVILDRDGRVGRDDPAGIDDLVLESAVTTIADLEDSVAAVDAEDKALGYRNWRGLMDGTLAAMVEKDGRTIDRRLHGSRQYHDPAGREFALPGRALLLIRNVGHLMTTDAVLDPAGEPIFEGILDAAMTALGSLVDLRGPSAGANSREGSMYIVKPKMHGPDEVAFAVELFSRVEHLLSLRENTIKIGIMDEERRTSANLAACIAAAAHRVAFINTGFLDRTGDEIHTSLYLGAMMPKAQLRSQPFMSTYEESNVTTGLAAGLSGRAQIGKGMWAMPDLMRQMLEQKGAQLRAGATTAWVPSPTAATLHTLHYHDIDVAALAEELREKPVPPRTGMLRVPLATGELDRDTVLRELDNNVQSILGYVVRWVDQGIGCSKVPDIAGVALMEDRATLRISSQLLANWLIHGVIDVADVDASLASLAVVVDGQNAGDPHYEELIPGGVPGLAYTAARRLIVEGAAQPNGYTEPILHETRRLKKNAAPR